MLKKQAAHEEWEQGVIAGAVYFTTARFKGRGRYDRREFDTLDAAREDAEGDPRALIYAVDEMGRQAHVSV